MASPMTAAELVAALKRWHVTVVEHDGWRTNNRNSVGAWGPVHGSMVHHTASADGTGIVEVCFNGRSDLPGPLCAGVVRKDGTVHLVGNGRANHAGSGSAAVFDAVVSEAAMLPRPGPDAIDGNARLYGWEAVNRGDGTDPWPEAQLDAIARVQAALCEHHSWSARSVIGHQEWTTRKIDPRGFTMASMRARVAAHLAAGPIPREEPYVALTAEDINKVASAVVVKLIAGGGVLETTDVNRVAAAVAAKTLPVTLTDAQVKELATNSGLAEAIAERVAAKLAARLAS
jgi:N-acetylmuramoyl-L-alanine amidase